MAFNTKQEKANNARYKESFTSSVGQIRKEMSEYRKACREARQNGEDPSQIQNPYPTMPHVDVNVWDDEKNTMVQGQIMDPFYGTHSFTKKEMYDLKNGKQVMIGDMFNKYGEQYATTVELKVDDLKDRAGAPVVDKEGETIRYPQIEPVSEAGTYTKNLEGCVLKTLDSDETHVPVDMKAGKCQINFDQDGYVLSAAGTPIKSVIVNEEQLKVNMETKPEPKTQAKAAVPSNKDDHVEDVEAEEPEIEI